MNIIDVVIILFIGLFGVIGFKRGFFAEAVNVVGIILVFVLSFMFKNPIADFFMNSLPFFEFFGEGGGAVSLNILLYQALAFLIVFALLMVVFRLVTLVTGAFEKLLKITIILAIPSKILGFILGLIEGYVIILVALVLFRQPAFNLEIFNDSGIAHGMINYTPVLTDVIKGTSDSITEIHDYVVEYNDTKDVNEFNLNALDSMLKHEVVTVSSVDDLVKSGKLNTVGGIENILGKYR